MFQLDRLLPAAMFICCLIKMFFTDQWCRAGRGCQTGRRQRGGPSSRGGERKRQLRLLGSSVRIQRHQHHDDRAAYPTHTCSPGPDIAGNALQASLIWRGKEDRSTCPQKQEVSVLRVKYLPLISALSGSPEPNGSDQHRHPSEGRPQHPAARERLQWRDTAEAADTNTQHSS